MNEVNSLINWVNNQLQQRDWSQNLLARKVGMSHGGLSNIMSGKSKVTRDFCADVARAFGYPETYTYRLAGFLESEPGRELIDKAVDILSQLPDDEIESVTDFAMWRYQRLQINRTLKKRMPKK